MAKGDKGGKGGFSGSLLKYTFGLVNLLIFIGGCVLLGIGAASLSGSNSAFSDIISESLFTGTAILIIVAGSFIVIVSFFGCCGAFRESRCMLGSFFCLVFILFVLTMAAAITGFVFGGDAITKTLRDAMTKSLKNYDKGDEAAIAAWDIIQQDFDCCGVDNYMDYENAPDSCYRDNDRNNPVNLRMNGCFSQALDFIDNNSALMGGIAMCVSIILILAMVCSCFLMRTVD